MSSLLCAHRFLESKLFDNVRLLPRQEFNELQTNCPGAKVPMFLASNASLCLNWVRLDWVRLRQIDSFSEHGYVRLIGVRAFWGVDYFEGVQPESSYIEWLNTQDTTP